MSGDKMERVDSNLGSEQADSFHCDMHPDLRADYI
jgi:hypothetical protein